MIRESGGAANDVGPGAYEPVFKESKNRQAPQYSMRVKTEENWNKNPNPGPGTYENLGKSGGRLC